MTGSGKVRMQDAVPPIRSALGPFSASGEFSAETMGELVREVSIARRGAGRRSGWAMGGTTYRAIVRPAPLTPLVDDAVLVVDVADEGRGMVPRIDSPGLGLGLALIAQVADVLEILDQRERPGVVVRMHFNLAGPPATDR
jgi:hypothetical protein